jgi:hypothetical protein
MTVPSSFNGLVEQINNELNALDYELSQAIELIRRRITLFPDNIISIQLFAILNNYSLFSENTRRRIQETLQYLSTDKKISEKIFKKQEKIYRNN